MPRGDRAYRKPPPTGASARDVATALGLALDGKANNVFEGTLAAGAASTVFTFNKIVGSQSAVLWAPLTSNAAAALTGMYISAQADGSVTISHANNAQVDRTFVFIVVG